MKTKKVTFYIDLPPNWQKFDASYLAAFETPNSEKSNGCKRVAFCVELPAVVLPCDFEIDQPAIQPVEIK